MVSSSTALPSKASSSSLLRPDQYKVDLTTFCANPKELAQILNEIDSSTARKFEIIIQTKENSKIWADFLKRNNNVEAIKYSYLPREYDHDEDINLILDSIESNSRSGVLKIDLLNVFLTDATLQRLKIFAPKKNISLDCKGRIDMYGLLTFESPYNGICYSYSRRVINTSTTAIATGMDFTPSAIDSGSNKEKQERKDEDNNNKTVAATPSNTPIQNEPPSSFTPK